MYLSRKLYSQDFQITDQDSKGIIINRNNLKKDKTQRKEQVHKDPI